ncbi:MAG TPA: glycoside hydrolase family 44 protein [Bryobacteraceae bacterium]|nr:glycoside hydrolase family 44 protein [Bryobacteraceae bacterium]HPQ15096.1 glycoside hydrolase family 44 protein [Bryobacteraceae bacterium]HPU71182.1 glycoside hydrolase family 44 protein [Bryobacteraceae bacterium]
MRCTLRFGFASLALLGLAFMSPAVGADVNLSVDVAAGRHPISPDIYGVNNYSVDLNLFDIGGITPQRYGGNHTSLYNWLVDSGNDGADNYFKGGSGKSPDQVVPGETIDKMVEFDISKGAKSIITVPLTGWVNRYSQITCSYPESLYPNQDAFADWLIDFQLNSRCGNGRWQGRRINQDPEDVPRNHLAITPEWIAAWMQHLKARFGDFEKAGLIFQMDNEPEGWPIVHRDVHPENPGFDEVVNATFAYGAAIKGVDRGAKILGPGNCCSWGMYGTIGPPGTPVGNEQMGKPGDDKLSHGDMPWGQYYLSRMKQFEEENGYRLLDYLAFTFYPSVDSEHAPGVQEIALSNATPNAVTAAARLRSTRALWDPTYKQENWQGVWFPDTFGTAMLIRKMKAWVNEYYPGTKTAIVEYNWGGFGSGVGGINGALAQADVLGIFGREGLDLATLWGPPRANRPAAFAFRMYLNYDGNGSRFGDTSVEATSSDQDLLSIYAAERGSDSALTIMVINKTATTLNPYDITSTIYIKNFLPAGEVAQVYRYSAEDVNAIVRQPDVPVRKVANQPGMPQHTVTVDFPANSITLIVIPRPGKSGEHLPDQGFIE